MVRMKADWKIKDLEDGSKSYICSACSFNCVFSLTENDLKAVTADDSAWKPECPQEQNIKKEEVFFTENTKEVLSNT